MPHQSPDGNQSVIPYLIVNDVQAVTDFLVNGLGARLKERSTTPDGRVMHSSLWIGDSVVMMGQASAEHPPMPTTLYVYVPDVDATFAQAVKAGAQVISEPKVQFYGDRSGGFMDPSGNRWWIGTHSQDVTDDEIARRYAQERQRR